MARRYKTNLPNTKSINIKFEKFPKGLNTLFSPSKIRDDELSQADNIVLVDEGSPTRRWGQDYFDNDATTGLYTLLEPYYNSDGTHELIRIRNGIAEKLSDGGSTWSVITGASFTSGIQNTAVMAFDTLYISNGVDNLTKYDGTSLTRFDSINTPTNLAATRGNSLVSGLYQYSYRISAVNAIGETLATSAVTISVNKDRDTWNIDPATLYTGFRVDLNWTASTGATGYNIYGVLFGDETYIGHVDNQTTTTYSDYGNTTPSNFFQVPTGNSTQGPKGKYITEFKSSLIIAGDIEQPSRLYYSAGVDKIDSFLISDGGGYLDISKNSNDGQLRGVSTFQNKIIAFKDRSVWALDFTESEIPSLTNIVKGIGCISHRTIREVENDLFFLGNKIGGGAAIYTLGNEPQFLNVLRTNELSTRVRPEMQKMLSTNRMRSNAVYYDGKYILFLTEGNDDGNNSAIIYDRERLGFFKWLSVHGDYSTVYYDENEADYLIIADNNDGRITRMSDTYSTDKGTAISWNVKTKDTDLDAPFLWKTFRWVNMKLRNIGGSVRIKIWTDATKTTYTATINADLLDTSFGSAKFGSGKFGSTISGGTSNLNDTIIRRVPIMRQGTNAVSKSIALELYGETTNSKVTLLDVEMMADPKPEEYYPRDEIVI